MKSNQKYGRRGGGKRMTKKVRSYLESYFLSGNMNKSDRMTANDMINQLQTLANEGEIQVEDVPEVSTVANWIKRYAASLKQLTSRIVEESNTISNEEASSNYEYVEVGSRETTMSSNEEASACAKGKKTISDNDNNNVAKRQKKS